MKFLLHLGTLTATLPSVLGSEPTSQSAVPACPPRPATPEEQENIFYDFANEFYVDYIQHNPFIGQGRDAAVAALSKNPKTNSTIVHQTFTNNTGFVHHYEFTTPPIKIMDAYRMNGSCIVEHWDVIASLTLAEIDPTPLSG
ncbi:uncharacterized protein Triagg1_7036 [Trichoderma aggressivum f. europaeum]|uniref:SnoaL-like domain-containing protein n=1 Tax=Trichoderma aggressivum f. europaeum TaxID=173218 RepID=A0AAE1IC35_9HYPO|nr:hypothetical protein Triagg1_7036 [Trichoderma aggressivum f. europaeum]